MSAHKHAVLHNQPKPPPDLPSLTLASRTHPVVLPSPTRCKMIGRAGRPQFDDHAVACILVHEPKKNFFKKFLYEPFPVESKLPAALHNHLSAECAGGAIRYTVVEGINRC